MAPRDRERPTSAEYGFVRTRFEIIGGAANDPRRAAMQPDPKLPVSDLLGFPGGELFAAGIVYDEGRAMVQRWSAGGRVHHALGDPVPFPRSSR